MDTLKKSKTLQEAIVYFSNPDNCVAYMVSKRWPDGVVTCPNCGSKEVKYMATRRVWQCKTRHPKSQFSVKVGSVYEDSAIGLVKWLAATWMVVNCKNGVSSYEIHRAVGVTQKSAWFMLHRIRLAMKEDNGNLTLGGQWGNPVEVDETYIGGKAKNKHLGDRKQDEKKTIVMGMLARGTREIRAKVIPQARREVLQGEILKNIGFNAHVFTDGHPGYEGLDKMKNL